MINLNQKSKPKPLKPSSEPPVPSPPPDPHGSPGQSVLQMSRQTPGAQPQLVPRPCQVPPALVHAASVVTLQTPPMQQAPFTGQQQFEPAEREGPALSSKALFFKYKGIYYGQVVVDIFILLPPALPVKRPLPKFNVVVVNCKNPPVSVTPVTIL